MPLEQQRLTIHGVKWAYVRRGSGPPLLFLHGIGSSLRTWDYVLPRFAEKHEVIAPDLIGHGASDKPRGEYSPSALANDLRDFLTVLNISRISIVGHSYGGGVAMQFAYQFPEFVERVVLVSTGGLGREVSPFLRMATLPGASTVLAAAEFPGLRHTVSRTARAVARIPDIGTVSSSILDLLEIYEGLSTSAARRAFQSTLRTAIGPAGQALSMLDRAYITATIPTLLLWGGRDYVLPVRHAHAGHSAMPGSRLEIFDRAGHVPHRQDPKRFVAVVEDFLACTPPAEYDVTLWKELLRARATGQPAAGALEAATARRPLRSAIARQRRSS